MTIKIIPCTFPKSEHKTLEEIREIMKLANYKTCGCTSFHCYFDNQTQLVTIRCCKHPLHILTTYYLNGGEVQKDGTIKEIGGDDKNGLTNENSNNGSDSTNISRNINVNN